MSSLQDILKTFNGFDLDADGVKEIETLQFVPFTFENASEPVDLNKKLVLVLVETRLFANLTGSSLSAAELAQRFATFKRDLLREGRQARFLQMTVHGGPPHQDGKTLLAVREFFRAVRTSFANFEGAILVGTFPEATIVRTWPESYQNNGQQCYGVGLTPGEPHRFEIVLADLDGNWEHLYQGNADAEGCTIRVTAATTTSQVGTKVMLVNPQIERTTRHLEDVFWLRDASYNITSLPDGATRVEIDLACLNPELNGADTVKPNPVARPSICVSRINARSIAVQPPSARLLDSTGKPTQASHTPPIDFSMEAWLRDAKLERRLLVDYFDRNHAFRSGKYSDRAFSMGLIEYNLGTFSVDEGFEGLNYPRDDVSNADLLDLVRWFKRPILLRAVSAHADCRSTFFRQNDAEAQAVELEAGGKPWRWVDQGNSYVPSFAGHCTGDLYLYRTLWENKQFSNVPPSLMVHVGCDVNWPDHCELPYDDSCYGTFQNAESQLFYANQLAVLCHPTWWNRGPMGFGEAFGASSSAVFGDGWKNVSEHIAQDPVLALQSTERKQNYIWSIVGDWTLQKYYPAWPYGRKINDHDSTPLAATTCGFKGHLHVFWKASDPGNGIHCSASSDGVHWPDGHKINTVDSTPEPPAACVFNNKLYLFWKANDTGNRIYYSASSDGVTWPNGHKINDVDSTPKAVTACVFKNKLYVFWQANDPGHGIYYSASSDGVTWPNGRRINTVDSTPEPPAACVFNNKLYLFWKANDTGNRIYCSASSDGVTWPNGRRINDFDSTPKTIAACVFQNRLYLFWKAADPGNRIYCSGSADGVTWPNAHRINDFDSTPEPPAACTLQENIYLLWRASDPGHRIFYSLNDAEHRV